MIKRLLEQKIENEQIYALLDFINLYLPFADTKKEDTFVQELDLLINQDINMEALTIKQYYENKVQGIIQRLENKAQRLENKADKAELRTQEESRMRQEESRMRQEAEQKLALAIRKLHNQGMPIETIADTLSQSVRFIQESLDKKT